MVVAWPGFLRRRVRTRQFLRLLKPCPAGARAAGCAWLVWPLGGVSFAGPGEFAAPRLAEGFCRGS